MTDRAHPFQAIEAVIKAGRGGGQSAPPQEPATKPQTAAHAGRPAQAVSPIDLRYATLLSRILAGSPPMVSPAVQFVACGAAGGATAIAFGIARATASLVGRTLLLDARLDPGTAAARSLAAAPLPDAFVPRLYHHTLQHTPADLALLYSDERREVLAALSRPFRFVAIDAPAPASGPAACALAPLCFGTVLVVQAGHDRSTAIAGTARDLAAIGARVIGVVMDNAPADLPAWAKA